MIRRLDLTALGGETENARHEHASKNQLGLRKKIFIRSTALYVFHISEPFTAIKTKYMLYYSSSLLNEQAVKCLGQFYITVQTFQQFSHFSTSSTQKAMSVRQIGHPKAEFSLRQFHVSHFLRPLLGVS